MLQAGCKQHLQRASYAVGVHGLRRSLQHKLHNSSDQHSHKSSRQLQIRLPRQAPAHASGHHHHRQQTALQIPATYQHHAADSQPTEPSNSSTVEVTGAIAVDAVGTMQHNGSLFVSVLGYSVPQPWDDVDLTAVLR